MFVECGYCPSTYIKIKGNWGGSYSWYKFIQKTRIGHVEFKVLNLERQIAFLRECCRFRSN